VNWEVIGYIGGFLTIVGFLIKLFERITRLETKIEPVWNFVLQQAAEKLHSPQDEYGMDWLLERFSSGTITLREAMRLRKLLEEKLHELPSDKKLAAALISLRLEEMIKNTRGKK
jgi:hypothetical protein